MKNTALVSDISAFHLKASERVSCFKVVCPSIFKKMLRGVSILLMIAAGMTVMPARAGIIDRIETEKAGDETAIQIKFVSRIQYLRQVQLENGDIRIYFNLLNADLSDKTMVAETRTSPASDISPAFTISYPELDSSLTVKAANISLWNYHISVGSDGRSINLFMSVFKPQSELSSKTSTDSVSPVAAKPLASNEPIVIQSENIIKPDLASQEIATPLAEKPVATEEVEAEASRLISSARFALQDNRAESAIGTLNRLLNLQPNQQSQFAQKLIAEAREKNGEPIKARVEYELYLKQYPNSQDAKEVQERLSHLSEQIAAKSAQAAPRAARKFVADEKMTITGGVSQYYYSGAVHINSTVGAGLGTAIAPVVTDLSKTDQSMLISTLDVTGRMRTETTDTRLVVRDSHGADYLPGKIDKNRLNAAYLEQSARDRTYLYRIGRQTGQSGGVPGRFDGVLAGYSLNTTWRVNAVVGTPVLFTTGVVEQKSFTGVSLDLTRAPEQWSGSGYLIEQRVGKIIDRKAIGMEAHFFDARRNYMGQLEYDALFNAINVGMFQGNWMTESGANYFVYADHRKSQPLQLTNALPGQTIQTMAGLLQSGVTLDTLRADSQALSPIANLFMAGMNFPYSAKLRLGGDFRVTNIHGTAASSTQAATPGTGNIYTGSFQAIANSVFRENDMGVVSASYTSAPTYTGKSLNFNQVEIFGEKWRLDMALQLYSQNDDAGNYQMRITPSSRLSYRLFDAISFEGEVGVDDTRSSNAMQNDKIRRKYFFLGYRWDLQY